MKKRVLAIIAGLFSITGILLSQSFADVVIEYNSGVRCLNNQAYDSAYIYLNNTLSLSDVVGTEADDMVKTAKEQLVYVHYSQASTLEKRKHYSEAVPLYEETVKLSKKFGVKEDIAVKAKKRVVFSSMFAGQTEFKKGEYDAALGHYDKVLSLQPSIYKAHQGKGFVYEKLDQPEEMLASFAIAKDMATEKGDQKVIGQINSSINKYFRGLIEEELMMIDPEEEDYTFLIDICDQALEANDNNAFAYYNAISAKNKQIEYDAAIEYGEKAIKYAADFDEKLRSAIFYELGVAYQNTVRYKEACAAYEKVTHKDFFDKAEKKMMTSNCQ